MTFQKKNVSAPLLDRDVDTHCDIHSITGKQLDLYFEVIGIPHFLGVSAATTRARSSKTLSTRPVTG